MQRAGPLGTRALSLWCLGRGHGADPGAPLCDLPRPGLPGRTY